MLCAAAGGVFSSVVDIFNAITATWTTAALSVSRGFLSASSLPNVGVALFAGGAQDGTQFDLNLSVCRIPCFAKELFLEDIFCSLYVLTLDLLSNAVDVYNGITGTWSTAALSVARSQLAATSLPNHGLAIFAGGSCTSRCVCLFELFRFLFLSGVSEFVEVAVQ
jgi:hypothetical protein